MVRANLFIRAVFDDYGLSETRAEKPLEPSSRNLVIFLAVNMCLVIAEEEISAIRQLDLDGIWRQR